MTGADPLPVAVSIGTVRVRASSSIDARRLADALPAALARALADGGTGLRPTAAADAAAWEIAGAIRRAREQGA